VAAAEALGLKNAHREGIKALNPGGAGQSPRSLPTKKPEFPQNDCRQAGPGENHKLAEIMVNSFHEKAGMSQVCFGLSVFSFLPVDSLHSSHAASVAILPSALLVERFSPGAWWAFPIQ
jgi:hypothetical protein